MTAFEPQMLGARLMSAFQPIFSFSHQRVVGYEGLLRGIDAQNGTPMTPKALFGQAEGGLGMLERTSQMLHIANFQAGYEAVAAPLPTWLFLNVSPLLIREGSYRDLLPEALEANGVEGSQVVVELLEEESEDDKRLAEAVAYFRSLGCLVALDDFGTGHSNFERLWELRPDLVKLDRSLIQRAASDPERTLRRILPNLVALIHEAGSLVVIEGVESEDQALLAMDADADLVQGFYFSYPECKVPSMSAKTGALASVTERFTGQALERLTVEQQTLQPYTQAFLQAAVELERTGDLAASCVELLAMERVQRCYVLNERGEQVGYHLLPTPKDDDPAGFMDPRYAPLVDTSKGSWVRRPYFRDALLKPRRLQVSRPYLSSTGGHVCTTLSIADQWGKGRDSFVFCCDLLW